ncbi:MAG: hypothetical protein V4598_07105 [Bdellovibrionota bacterium]
MRFLILVTLLFTFDVATAQQLAENTPLDASYVCESSDASIRPGDACYNECRPSRSFLGLGRPRVGLDRSSCLPCLQQNSERYPLRSEYRSSGGAAVPANASLDASIVCQTSDAEIRSGDACYNECKPSRGPLGLGKVRIGLDRSSCLPCLQRHPEKFRLRGEFTSEPDGVNCTLSDDQQIAVCQGKTYRLDSSVSDSPREIIEKVQGGRTGTSSGRNSGRVNEE